MYLNAALNLWILLDFCKAMVNSKIQNTFFTVYCAQNYRTIICLLFVSISPKKIQQILSERKTWYLMNVITTKFSILQPLVRNWNFKSKATLHKDIFPARQHKITDKPGKSQHKNEWIICYWKRIRICEIEQSIFLWFI